MSSLKTFIKSLQKGEVLLPAIRRHLEQEDALLRSKQIESKEIVMADADMAIACFQERKKEYNHRQRLVGDYYHPSQLGQCLRRMYYDELHAPIDRNKLGEDLLKEALTFEVGTYFHVLFQNLCQRAGVLVAREAPIVNPKLRIIGHADGILLIDGIKYLLEIKTINSRGFTMLTGPKYEHKLQITAYMKALGLKWAVVLYYSKDDSKVKEFVIQYDEEVYLREVAPRIETYFKSIRSRSIPDREGTSVNAFPCTFCQFKRICWDSRENDKWVKAVKSKPVNNVVKAKPSKLKLRFRK